jgi:hypothetical protein
MRHRGGGGPRQCQVRGHAGRSRRWRPRPRAAGPVGLSAPARGGGRPSVRGAYAALADEVLPRVRRWGGGERSLQGLRGEARDGV